MHSPEKNMVEGQRQSDAFVEERRAALEGYLNKLAQHPAIGSGEVGVLACCVWEGCGRHGECPGGWMRSWVHVSPL